MTKNGILSGSVALCLLMGTFTTACTRRPLYAYEGQEDVSVATFREIALDPREDLLLIEEGRRPVDATYYKALVMRELQAMGYRTVPPGQARLWVQVLASRKDVDAPLQGNDPPGHGGRNGKGGAPRGNTGRPAGDHPRPLVLGGASLVAVTLLDPSDAHPRWRAVLDLSVGDKASRPAPEILLKRLLDPLRPGEAPVQP
jgi:hypothetical protein